MADPKKPEPVRADPPKAPGASRPAEPDPAYPDRSAIPSHGAEQPKLVEPFKAAAPVVAPADAGHEAAGPVEWAADLIRELAATGTGADKFEKVRRAMLERFNAPAHAKKPADSPDRHLTAREGLDVLEADGQVPELTRVKARALVESGAYVPAASAVLHDADRLPPPPKGKAADRGVTRTDVERAAAQRTIATGTMPFDAAGDLATGPKRLAGPETDAERAKRVAGTGPDDVGLREFGGEPKKGK